MNIRIRAEATADIAPIEVLTKTAFLSAEHTSHTEHLIVNALRRVGALTLSLVAEEDGQVIGHAAVSLVTIDGTASCWQGLAPVSVLPERQGRGVGSQLIRHLLAKLEVMGADSCVVLGNPDYYRRFGFQPEKGLVLPGVPAAYFQALPFGADVPSGTVAFHAAFDVAE